MKLGNHFFRSFLALTLIFTLSGLVSCVPGGGGERITTATSSSEDCDPTVSSCPSASNSSEEGSYSNPIETDVSKVELRFIVDPVDGTYAKKVTIPKNFSGILYISGLNISSLFDRHIGVRFRFGQSLEPIIMEATPARGSGLTPQTDVLLLALDFSNKPFQNLKLLYDLYDYSDYSAADSEPIQDPLDRALFCRGLDLAYDNTFTDGSGTCTSSDDICKYAYAKVRDRTFINATTFIPTYPTRAQTDITGTDYTDPQDEYTLIKCLGELDTSSSLTDYLYAGPFYPINQANWEISQTAIVSDNGIFRRSNTCSLTAAQYPSIHCLNLGTTAAPSYFTGLESNLFPRYGKTELRQGVSYFGAGTDQAPDVVKTQQTMTSNDDSTWMDGCNIRAQQYDSYTNEGIGSCNISALIEIVEIDPTTLSVNSVIAGMDDGGKSIKLQVTRAQELDNDGEDVLYTSFKRCENDSGCGSEECCFSNRCWSNSLVSMCIGDSNNQGNYPIGDECSNDLDCSSFCCTNGRCAVHDNSSDDPVLCSHPTGSQCIAKEWCQKQNVTRCFIVTTGVDNLGQTTCTRRCYTVQEFPDCKNGLCTPKDAPVVPSFDPDNPDCSDAISPSQINLYGDSSE